jgi:nicotinamidase/pyrazinamidase
MNTDQTPISLSSGDALLVIHVQNDFLPGGALAVPGGNEVVPVLNRYIARFRERSLPILATRDWHPPDHCSFREHGGPWPVHCVAGSKGAAFATDLALPKGTPIVSQATRPEKEAYSSFEDTELHCLLQNLRVKRLFAGGLATDYCVLHTVLDALALGYRVVVLRDAVRAVDVLPGDGARAFASMEKKGARFASWEDLR